MEKLKGFMRELNKLEVSLEDLYPEVTIQFFINDSLVDFEGFVFEDESLNLQVHLKNRNIELEKEE